MKNKPYVYIIVREDISSAQKVVQASHAVLEAGQKFGYPMNQASIIILEVSDKDALFEAHYRLTDKGIDNFIFHEPDFGMGESALATRAMYGNERHIMRKYKLLKH